MPKKRQQDSLPQYSKQQLGEMFGLARGTVRSRLRNLKPSGKCKRGFDTFTLPDAAYALVDPPEGETIPSRLGEVDPDQMPPEMRKDHYEAELKRQKFLLQEGDLWPSGDVLEAMAGILKPMAFSMRALTDTIERRHNLTPDQVDAIQAEVDKALKACYDGVREYAGELSERE